MGLGWEGHDLIMESWSSNVDIEGWIPGVLVRHPLGSERFDTIARYARGYRSPSRSSSEPPDPFRPSGNSGMTDGAVMSVWGEHPEVKVTSLRGKPPVIVRWRDDPRGLSDRLWNEYLAYSEIRRFPPHRTGASARSRAGAHTRRRRRAGRRPVPHLRVGVLTRSDASYAVPRVPAGRRLAWVGRAAAAKRDTRQGGRCDPGDSA